MTVENGRRLPHRLTIMIKVTQPQILTKLQAELLEQTNIAYIVRPERTSLFVCTGRRGPGRGRAANLATQP